ncbi:MAG: hypothetical protein KY432_00760, partial [Acidobacteria bacterium]|nr:hypothetical protein [Acidobacteriota bacterium]
MTSFDSEAFEFALSQIKDGDIFERFAQDFLCQYKGQNFHPVGGIHDRGIDGLERCYEPEGVRQTIYQMSIEADTRAKVRKTLTALQKAEIPCTRLFYVTSRKVKDQDSLEEEMFDEFGVVAKVHDLVWLRGNVNSNEGTLRTYLTLIESHFHQFTSAGSSPIAIDFESDPRLYVFLRQQWEASGRSARLDEVLVDSLILFALEG